MPPCPARAVRPQPGAIGALHPRAPLQRFAVQTLQRHLRELRGRHVEDGAVIVLDNASGDVLAWVGSSGELSQAAEVDGVLALRQPGSTLKPFLYAQAIAEQRLTAASLLDDARADQHRRRPVHPAELRPALQGLGLGAHRAGRLAERAGGAHAGDGLARRLPPPAAPVGLPLKQTGDYYGYSLALGSAEVSLLELTNAYRTLANGGRLSAVAPPLARAKPPPPKWSRVIDPGAAFIVGDILSDPNARARTFGTDSVLATRFWTAVKTGTSKDMRDNWAVGWTAERYTVGVWVGNASGAPMHEVSGTHGAAPVWAAVMQYLHAREPSRAPRSSLPPAPPPARLVCRLWRRVLATHGNPPSSRATEWFLEGTEQPHFSYQFSS